MAITFWGFLFIIKAENAYKNQMIIYNAIVDYDKYYNDCEKALKLLKNVEDYTSTVFRLWDWGYTRILPKEDFELIKPYIQEKRNGRKKSF
jgi:hypothetical protein